MVAKKQENKSSQDVESSKNGDLKSRQSDRTKAERRNLGIILGTLCVLAAVLAVFVIVIGVQKGNKTQEPEPEVAEDQSGMTEEQTAELKKLYQEAVDYQKSATELREQADSLLARDSVKAEEIINLYNPRIEESSAAEAYPFVLDEADALISKGYKKEALEELIKNDRSEFGPMNLGVIYQKIIDLATELGESEVASKYSGLLNKLGEAVPRGNMEETANE